MVSKNLSVCPPVTNFDPNYGKHNEIIYFFSKSMVPLLSLLCRLTHATYTSQHCTPPTFTPTPTNSGLPTTPNPFLWPNFVLFYMAQGCCCSQRFILHKNPPPFFNKQFWLMLYYRDQAFFNEFNSFLK